jgi:hypothetical protein
MLFCLTYRAVYADCAEPKELDVSVMLLNFKQPLMSSELAEKFTRLFLQERYPANIFQLKSPAHIVDGDKTWSVSLR